MRIGRLAMVLVAGLLAGFGVPDAVVSAGPVGTIQVAQMTGVNMNLVVRQVTVTPVRAYVGDKIHVEMVVENKDEGAGKTSANIYANKKRVGSRLFSWGKSGERLFRLSFDWNTSGLPPGQYTIRGEAPLWNDSSPFDNELVVKQPVILVPPGGTFPGGEGAGGTATETDPRFRKKPSGG